VRTRRVLSVIDLCSFAMALNGVRDSDDHQEIGPPITSD